MTTKLTGHGTITVEHGGDGVILRQEDQLGDDPSAVFIPFDRLDAVIAMMRPPSAPKLVE
jgi:hypothetical protein